MLVDNLINYLNLLDDNHAFSNIAEFIVKHMDQVVAMHLETLADACFVSPATVSRFCRSFGFGSYTDLRLACQKELDSIERRRDAILSVGNRYADLGAQFVDYAEILCHEMMNVAAHLDVAEIHELIREIDHTEDVVFVDVNYALFYAQDLQRTLALNKKVVRCHTRLEKQVECVEGLGKDSLVVAFSVNLGFGSRWNDVYKALLKCPCKKILVSSEPITEKTCFDRIISVDKSGQPPVGPKYGMMYYMEAVISAYYQMKSKG